MAKVRLHYLNLPSKLTIFINYLNEQVKTLDDDTTGIAQQPTVVLEISENKIDQVMSMLNEADPTLPESDPIGNFAIA